MSLKIFPEDNALDKQGFFPRYSRSSETRESTDITTTFLIFLLKGRVSPPPSPFSFVKYYLRFFTSVSMAVFGSTLFSRILFIIVVISVLRVDVE